MGEAEICPQQRGTIEDGIFKFRAGKTSASQLGTIEFGIIEVEVNQINVRQIATGELTAPPVDLFLRLART